MLTLTGSLIKLKKMGCKPHKHWVSAYFMVRRPLPVMEPEHIGIAF